MNLINTASYIFLIFILTVQSLNGQILSRDLENTDISILTCRSGDELYSTFGHTAIRIHNPDLAKDVTYNYGVFSFNTPNFYLKFMRGKLPYFLSASRTEYFLKEYQYEQRSVFEQKLNLNSEQKKEIINFLIENAKKENRYYKYEFFFDNCTTRAVDLYSLAGEVEYTNEIESKTFRDLLKENLSNLVWSDFGIDLVIGAKADQITSRRDQMFLPEYVMENIDNATLNDSLALASSPELILDFERLNVERKKKSTNYPFILTTFLLIIVVALNLFKVTLSKHLNKALLILSGIMGLFLLFMWFGTDHNATGNNWNLLWLNPLFLLIGFANEKIRKALSYLLMVMLAVSGVNCVVTILPQFFNIGFLPLILLLGFALYKYSQLSIKQTVSV